MRILLILLVLTIGSQADGQSNFLNFGVEKFGLSVEEPFHRAYHLHQDSMGRLIAFTDHSTKNEILTYDGLSFKKRAILKPSESLLYPNDQGGFWKLTDPFIATYVKGDLEVSLNVRDYLGRNICHLYIYKGDHYLLANDGYIKFNLIDNEIHVKEHHQYPVTRLERAHFVGDTIYLNQQDKLMYVLQSNPDSIIYNTSNPKIAGSLLQLTNGRVLLNSTTGDRVINANSEIYDYLERHDDYVMSPLIDSKGRFWCNLRRSQAMGCFVLMPGAKDHQEVELGIEKTNLLGFFEDNLGDIWVSTSTQGIVHLFDQSIRTINKSTGTTTDNISSVFTSPSNGKVYTSLNYQGIDILNGEGKSTIHHIESPASANATIEDQNGRLWVICGGVILIEDDQIVKHYTKKDGFHSGSVTCIFEDSSGNIWAGTRQVLHKYEDKDDRFKKYQIPDLDVYDRIVGIAELNNNQLLLAIDIGKFYIFDGESFHRLDIDGIIPNAIFTDLDGTIWMASENKGLFYWDDRTFVGIASNLDHQQNIQVLQDSNNGLLFGLCADNKIFYAYKSDLKTNSDPKSIKWLSIDNGLPLISSESRRQKSTAILSTGEVVFPNVYGAIAIDPQKIFAPKTDFEIGLTLNDQMINDSKVELPYGENDLTLRLSNIYLNPQAGYANQYRIGDDAWVDIPPNQDLELRNLQRGNAQVLVRAKHINGEWMTPIEFSVFVPALLYQRWWFIIGFLILMGLLIYAVTKNRIKVVQSQNNKLEQLVSEQTIQLTEEKQQLAESLAKQKELTTQLNLTQASKNRMYAQISHEFKSPLQAIKSHLSKNKGLMLGEAQQRIKGNINHLLDISNEIMELSKAESGNLKIKKNWYNINGIISDQVALKLDLAAEKNITIKHPPVSSTQYLSIDISLMQKVVTNLLSNAIKFSPIGGTITINSTTDGSMQEINIVDEGPGIPTDEIQNLTLAYYQATNNTEDGTGIGLSLAQEILRLHGSQLMITSRLGSGSSFGFRIQRPQISQAEIVEKNINRVSLESQLREIVNPKKQIILAVDDSLDVLYFLQRSLSPTYYVLTAMNGQEALLALEKIDPIAIVSDFNMPIMNGIQLLNKVRENPKHRALPFVFLTGSSSEETELLSIKSGADIILQKPIQESILITQISQLINRQKTISDSIKNSFAHDLLPTNINNDDIALMNALESIFLDNINNGQLKSEEIAHLMGIGEKTLRNRVKTITGLTIIKYFRNFRLEKAKLLLEEGYGNMGEVAVATGFSSLSYFSKSYKGYFSQSKTDT